MAIVTMKKLTLLAMESDKEAIFDALIKTNSVELKRSADIDACRRVDSSAEREKLAVKIVSVEDDIQFVAQITQNYNSAHKRSKEVAEVKLPKNSFARPLTEIDYDYFLNFESQTERIEKDLDALKQLKQDLSQNEAIIAQKRAELFRMAIIQRLPHPTTWYKDTDASVVRLSQFNASETDNIRKLAESYPLVDLEVLDVVGSTALCVVVAHKSETEFFEKATAYGLVRCEVTCDVLPQTYIEDIQRQINGYVRKINEITEAIVSFAENTAEWKIYVDYLELCAKKLAASGDLENTDKTFVLEAYYPAESEEKVQSAIESISNNMILTFDEIGEEEFAPTLIKSNKVVKPFEFVTNMYTPPEYHEVDPNPVMSLFYFIIFGFMVADIGYGALLALAGLIGTLVIKQRSAIKTMLQLFGICGISAMAVGALFGSMFCYTLYEGVIPDPSKFPMVMMVLCLFLGIVHICAGIGCKMAVKIKHKQHLAAWLADFPWIITLLSLILAIFNMALDMAAYEPYNVLRLPDTVSQVSLYVCLGSLAVSVIFAGLGSKGILGKVKSSFGSLYGVINYFSDVMSYIRIFGLMLSSALVGSVINEIGTMLAGNAVGYVMAGVVLVIAHLFNLIMGILGVYIHNGRLAYVEFFGKFYTGDGQLFVPFGSDTRYVLLKD